MCRERKAGNNAAKQVRTSAAASNFQIIIIIVIKFETVLTSPSHLSEFSLFRDVWWRLAQTDERIHLELGRTRWWNTNGERIEVLREYCKPRKFRPFKSQFKQQWPSSTV